MVNAEDVCGMKKEQNCDDSQNLQQGVLEFFLSKPRVSLVAHEVLRK